MILRISLFLSKNGEMSYPSKVSSHETILLAIVHALLTHRLTWRHAFPCCCKYVGNFRHWILPSLLPSPFPEIGSPQYRPKKIIPLAPQRVPQILGNSHLLQSSPRRDGQCIGYVRSTAYGYVLRKSGVGDSLRARLWLP